MSWKCMRICDNIFNHLNNYAHKDWKSLLSAEKFHISPKSFTHWWFVILFILSILKVKLHMHPILFHYVFWIPNFSGSKIYITTLLFWNGKHTHIINNNIPIWKHRRFFEKKENNMRRERETLDYTLCVYWNIRVTKRYYTITTMIYRQNRQPEQFQTM